MWICTLTFIILKMLKCPLILSQGRDVRRGRKQPLELPNVVVPVYCVI